MRIDGLKAIEKQTGLEMQVMLDVLFKRVKRGNEVHYLPKSRFELYSMLYKYTGKSEYIRKATKS